MTDTSFVFSADGTRTSYKTCGHGPAWSSSRATARTWIRYRCPCPAS